MRWWMRMGAAALLVLAGCAADPALQQARQTVILSGRVVEDADAMPVRATVPAPATERLRRSVHEARRELNDAEQTVEIWEDSGAGRLGWATLAPCLGDALEELGKALRAAGIEPPSDLEQAITMARSAGEGRCARVKHSSEL